MRTGLTSCLSSLKDSRRAIMYASVTVPPSMKRIQPTCIGSPWPSDAFRLTLFPPHRVATNNANPLGIRPAGLRTSPSELLTWVVDLSLPAFCLLRERVAPVEPNRRVVSVAEISGEVWHYTRNMEKELKHKRTVSRIPVRHFIIPVWHFFQPVSRKYHLS